ITAEQRASADARGSIAAARSRQESLIRWLHARAAELGAVRRDQESRAACDSTSNEARRMTYLRGLLIIALPVETISSTSRTSSPKAIPVEIWRVGDDGLTLRLAGALEEAFKTSHGFVLSRGRKPGSLIVSILQNVRWDRVVGQVLLVNPAQFCRPV